MWPGDLIQIGEWVRDHYDFSVTIEKIAEGFVYLSNFSRIPIAEILGK